MNKDDSNKQHPKLTIKDKKSSAQSTEVRHRRHPTPSLEDHHKKCYKSLSPRRRPTSNSLLPPKNNDNK